MELLVALGIGLLAAAGIYLTLRARTFDVVLGLTLLSYAVNLFIFTMGRLTIGKPPITGNALAPTLAPETCRPLAAGAGADRDRDRLRHDRDPPGACAGQPPRERQRPCGCA
jgi:hypothetical protein